jgi:hypothetical protein
MSVILLQALNVVKDLRLHMLHLCVLLLLDRVIGPCSLGVLARRLHKKATKLFCYDKTKQYQSEISTHRGLGRIRTSRRRGCRCTASRCRCRPGRHSSVCNSKIGPDVIHLTNGQVLDNYCIDDQGQDEGSELLGENLGNGQERTICDDEVFEDQQRIFSLHRSRDKLDLHLVMAQKGEVGESSSFSGHADNSLGGTQSLSIRGLAYTLSRVVCVVELSAILTVSHYMNNLVDPLRQAGIQCGKKITFLVAVIVRRSCRDGGSCRTVTN